MGCDIHCYAEIKYRGKWRYAGEIEVDRDYELFTKMAGVRDCDKNIEPISMPKGRPRDIDELTNCVMNMGNCDHSESYLTFQEIKILFKWIKKRNMPVGDTKLVSYFFCNAPFAEFLDDAELPEGFEDIRIIFSFDN
jgi:hypothetical protein